MRLTRLRHILWIFPLFSGIAARGQEVFQGHTDKVVAVAAHPDSLWMVSGSYDNRLIFWDVVLRSMRWNQTGHAVAVKDVAFSPDGKVLASAGMDKAVKLWEVPGGRLIRSLPMHPGGIYSLAFHPSEPLLATGCYDHKVRIFNYQTRRELHSMTHRGRVNDVAFSPDGRWVAAVTGDPFTPAAHNLKIWDAAGGREVFSWDKPVKELRNVAFTPDGKFLIAGGAPTTVFVFRVQDTAVKLLGGLKGFQFGIFSLAVDPKGQYMAVGGGFDKKVYVYRLPAFKRVQILEGHEGTIEDLAFLPDGRLISGSIDNTVRVWAIHPETTSKKTKPAAQKKTDKTPPKRRRRRPSRRR